MKHHTPDNKVIIKNTRDSPRIILVDIDGTVAHKGDRSPYDYSKVLEDTPQKDIVELLQTLHPVFKIGFVTGRDESCRKDTLEWLNNHIPFEFEFLYMRKVNDKRGDDIIKHEIASEIATEWSIHAVFDDRNRVVEMWRKAGIRCLQVQDGNF